MEKLRPRKDMGAVQCQTAWNRETQARPQGSLNWGQGTSPLASTQTGGFVPHSLWVHFTHGTEAETCRTGPWMRVTTQSPDSLNAPYILCASAFGEIHDVQFEICYWYISWHKWVPTPLIPQAFLCRNVCFGRAGQTWWDWGIPISFPAVHHPVPRLPSKGVTHHL